MSVEGCASVPRPGDGAYQAGRRSGLVPPHALVVGGTGMLRGVSIHLAERGHTVTVVARRRTRLRAVARAASGALGSIVPMPLDYRDSTALRAALLDVQLAHGPISLVVCWTHSIAPVAPEIVAAAVRPGEPPCRFFHVLGSATADPSRSGDGERFAGRAGLHYRQVILGFVRERGRSRWLTHEEISAGVIGAIEHDRPRTVVGVTEPWPLRPG